MRVMMVARAVRSFMMVVGIAVVMVSLPLGGMAETKMMVMVGDGRGELGMIGARGRQDQCQRQSRTETRGHERQVIRRQAPPQQIGNTASERSVISVVLDASRPIP